MTDTADLKGSIHVVRQIIGIAQQKCFGKGHQIFRETLLQQLLDIFSDHRGILKKCVGRGYGVRCLSRFIGQKKRSVSGVVSCPLLSLRGGDTKAEVAGDTVTGCDLLLFIQIGTDLIGFPIDLHFSIHAHTVSGLVAVIRSCNGSCESLSVQIDRRIQIILLKQEKPDKTHANAKEYHCRSS